MNPAIIPLIGRAIAWFTAAFITTEIVDVVEPEVYEKTHPDGKHMPIEALKKQPLTARVLPTVLVTMIGAGIFYGIINIVQRITKK